MSADYIFNKPLPRKEKEVLQKIAERQAKGDDSDIDYSDYGTLTANGLAPGSNPC